MANNTFKHFTDDFHIVAPTLHQINVIIYNNSLVNTALDFSPDRLKPNRRIVIVVPESPTSFAYSNSGFLKGVELTFLVLLQQQPSSCYLQSTQYPLPCLRKGCTRTSADAPSELCPKYGPFQIYLKELKTQMYLRMHKLYIMSREPNELN